MELGQQNQSVQAAVLFGRSLTERRDQRLYIVGHKKPLDRSLQEVARLVPVLGHSGDTLTPDAGDSEVILTYRSVSRQRLW